jgi:hypothetical protein
MPMLSGQAGTVQAIVWPPYRPQRYATNVLSGVISIKDLHVRGGEEPNIGHNAFYLARYIILIIILIDRIINGGLQ